MRSELLGCSTGHGHRAHRARVQKNKTRVGGAWYSARYVGVHISGRAQGGLSPPGPAFYLRPYAGGGAQDVIFGLALAAVGGRVERQTRMIAARVRGEFRGQVLLSSDVRTRRHRDGDGKNDEHDGSRTRSAGPSESSDMWTSTDA